MASLNSFANSVQSVSTAQSIAKMTSSLGSVLDEFGVNQESKQQIMQTTKATMNICDNYEDFKFDTAQIYARPIQQIGSHQTEEDVKSHKQNAERASRGYHHALIILSGGHPEPLQFVIDRVEAVRFVKVNVIQEELNAGHLILIREYTNINLKYETLREFIVKESDMSYNLPSNNCLNFAYNFIHEVVHKNEWRNREAFWSFIQKRFDKSDIKKGLFNQQQNDFLEAKARRNLDLQDKIRFANDKALRASWKVGDKLLIKSTNSKAMLSWYFGIITTIDHSNNVITVKFKKMGCRMQARVPIDDNTIKPYIKIPSNFLDPITNKVMTKPVQIIKSGIVYDEITVKYMQYTQNWKGGYRLDPITGGNISVGMYKKIVVIRRKDIENKIKHFRSQKSYSIDPKFINDFNSLNNNKLWQNVWLQLFDKYDIKKQQQIIKGKSITVFYPENESKINEENMLLEDEESPQQNDSKEDTDLLKWNADYMFVNHTSIPIITCMGPSRIGKSFLLNEIVRRQPMMTDAKNAFQISSKGDIAQTKGAWITLYDERKDNNENEQKQQNENAKFVDLWPEDDISLWSTDEVNAWIRSLDSNYFAEKNALFEHITEMKLNGSTLIDIMNVESLTSLLGNEYDALSLKHVFDQRQNNCIDEIDHNKIDQMYLIDMEGLSHGVTQFTRKLFHGCYAISNVVIWFDSEVNSDNFNDLMSQIKKNMTTIVNSNRKPAFIYVLRNADNVDFDFDLEDDWDGDEHEFDHYVKESDTFQSFRDMNIFVSYHGFQLLSPDGLKKASFSKKKRNKNKKQKKLAYKAETLDELIEKIKEISDRTKRFANNAEILNNQINNINTKSELSLERRIAICNSKLRPFVLSSIADKRKSQIKSAVLTFHYDEKEVSASFFAGIKSLKKQLQNKTLRISNAFDNELKSNLDEIVTEVKWYTSFVGQIVKNLQIGLKKTIELINPLVLGKTLLGVAEGFGVAVLRDMKIMDENEVLEIDLPSLEFYGEK